MAYGIGYISIKVVGRTKPIGRSLDLQTNSVRVFGIEEAIEDTLDNGFDLGNYRLVDRTSRALKW